jgi:hypothetical protein
MNDSLAARYAAASEACGGHCPIEAGVLGMLADNECRHGRLASDRTTPCGCWPNERAMLVELPQLAPMATERAA